MLEDRTRKHGDDTIVYHYCSADTLLAIIQNRTIRFSDINMMNDAEEGLWGYKVFEEAATDVIKRQNLGDEAKALIEGLDEEFVDMIDAAWFGFGLRMSGVISCFSTDGDSLSQWRAYADDGKGFAIGFRVGELRRLPIQIIDVEYDHRKQQREMEIAIAATYMEYVEKGRDKTNSMFFETASDFALSALSFKNPAWRDEKEVRCLHVLDVNVDDDVWTIKDEGGISDGQPVDGQQVRFQARNGAIVAFVDLPFEVSTERAPIAEIVLGPKCPNAPGNIRFLLGNSGYGAVTIRTAGSAYR